MRLSGVGAAGLFCHSFDWFDSFDGLRIKSSPQVATLAPLD
jgi:hypothetical protein